MPWNFCCRAFGSIPLKKRGCRLNPSRGSCVTCPKIGLPPATARNLSCGSKSIRKVADRTHLWRSWTNDFQKSRRYRARRSIANHRLPIQHPRLVAPLMRESLPPARGRIPSPLPHESFRVVLVNKKSFYYIWYKAKAWVGTINFTILKDFIL